jgi:hypothetical protein
MNFFEKVESSGYSYVPPPPPPPPPPVDPHNISDFKEAMGYDPGLEKSEQGTQPTA